MEDLVVKVDNKVRKELESEGIDPAEFARKALEYKAFESEFKKSKELTLSVLESIRSKSSLTEEEAIEWGRKLKKGRFEKLKSQGLV